MKPRLVKILVKPYDLQTDEGVLHITGEVAVGAIRKDGSFYGVSFDNEGELEGETKYTKEQLRGLGDIHEI